MTTFSDPMERLAAESDIRNCLLRYARGVDRLDMELVRACYHPDATDSHGSFSGTVEKFLPWVEFTTREHARVAVTAWSRVDRETGWWPIPDGMVQGRRDRTDSVYDR